VTGDGFQVRPDQLRADGEAMQSVAEQFVSVVQEAAGGVAAAGQPWGGDEIGMIIGETHDVVAQALFDFFSEVLETLRSDGADLVLMADRYAAVEQTEQARFDRLGEQLR